MLARGSGELLPEHHIALAAHGVEEVDVALERAVEIPHPTEERRQPDAARDPDLQRTAGPVVEHPVRAVHCGGAPRLQRLHHPPRPITRGFDRDAQMRLARRAADGEGMRLAKIAVEADEQKLPGAVSGLRALRLQRHFERRAVELARLRDGVRISLADEGREQLFVEIRRRADQSQSPHERLRHGRGADEGGHEVDVDQPEDEKHADELVRPAPVMIGEPQMPAEDGDARREREQHQHDQPRHRRNPNIAALPLRSAQRDGGEVRKDEHRARQRGVLVRDVHLIQPAEERFEGARAQRQHLRGGHQNHRARRDDLADVFAQKGGLAIILRWEDQPQGDVDDDEGDQAPISERFLRHDDLRSWWMLPRSIHKTAPPDSAAWRTRRTRAGRIFSHHETEMSTLSGGPPFFPGRGLAVAKHVEGRAPVRKTSPFAAWPHPSTARLNTSRAQRPFAANRAGCFRDVLMMIIAGFVYSIASRPQVAQRGHVNLLHYRGAGERDHAFDQRDQILHRHQLAVVPPRDLLRACFV